MSGYRTAPLSMSHNPTFETDVCYTERAHRKLSIGQKQTPLQVLLIEFFPLWPKELQLC